MKCENCGKIFDKNRLWQKFCSRKCLEYSSNHKVEHVCLYCGEIFHGQKKSKFCSRVCQHKSQIKYKKCSFCGKEFIPPHKDTSYCSRKCSSAVKSINNSTKTECNYCKKEITRPNSLIKEYVFCDKYCMGKYYSENNFGERHPLWRGGKIDGRGYKWREIRKIILERDGYSCKICGIQPKITNNLDVHHLIKYRDFNNSKEANKLSNLILVCKSCHTKVFTNNFL